MKYGYFSAEKREYIITQPDTPTPWINYLSNSEYCAMVSNTGGGYSFHIDPRDRRILRYRYNNLPMDRPGRYLYIRDNQTSEYWSPTWQPVAKELESYECRHGTGYTIIESSYNQIESRILYFVPINDNLEIWEITMKNHSKYERELSIFSYAEFCLWRALHDQTDLQYIQNIAVAYCENNIIYYHLQDLGTGYAFFTSNDNIKGFDCDREEFIGKYRSEANPLCVEKGKCNNSKILGGNPIAATENKVTLNPEEEITIIFLLGVSSRKEEIQQLIKKYKTLETVEMEFNSLLKSWNEYLNALSVSTPDKDFDLVINLWNPYQCKTTFDWSRYVSFYETGIGRGMGFRDSNQDTFGMCYAMPSRVRQRLIDLAKNQFRSGKAYHVYFPLTGTGGFPEYTKKEMQFFSDDHLWLILAVTNYIKETGDWTILDEEIPFVDESSGTLFKHLEHAIEFTINNLGPHKLPLIGTADWNDTLNLPGKNNHGESVWVAMQLHRALIDLIQLSKRKNLMSKVNLYEKLAEDVKELLNTSCWDGKWYIRAFTDDGMPIGSSNSQEGKIFLNPQTWSVISEVSSMENARKCLDSVKEFLDTDYGVKLFTPAFTRYYHELGGISTFPPGLKENAAIFCHTNPWLIIAECMIGRGDLAYTYYEKILPTTKNKISEIHQTEPYIYSQMIAGNDHPKFGLAKNSWLTGTAAWSMYAATQWILGIRPDYNGLLIDPCIPSSWNGFKVKRKFRDAFYEITVKNPNHVSNGIKAIHINGKIFNDGIIIPIFPKGTKNKIEVIMG